MKKHAGTNKLSLDRETLMPLQSEQLDGVHGGVTPLVTIASAGLLVSGAMAVVNRVGGYFTVGPRAR
jgi:hypothetical protein